VSSIQLDGANKLIVGHSNTTGQLFGLLGCETVEISEQEYGDIFMVRFSIMHGEQNKKDVKPEECSRYKLY